MSIISEKISVKKPVIPEQVNVPLDARTVCDSVDDFPNIELPYIGMIVFTKSDGKYWKITKLQEKQIGFISVADAQIAEFEEFGSADGGGVEYSEGDGISISEKKVISIDFEIVAKKEHGHTGYAQVKHSHAAADINGLKTGLNYIYFDVPDESQINAGDRLLLEIDFDNADDFSSKVSFSQADCQLFNPATGNWISIPQDGIDLAMASSKLRFPMPEISYSNCRYRWKVVDGTVGSYYTAII